MFHEGLADAFGRGVAVVLSDPVQSGLAIRDLFGRSQAPSPPTSMLLPRSQQPIAGALAPLERFAEGVLPEFLGGTPSVALAAPRRGGIAIGGTCPGVFHATPTGRVLPNTITLVNDGLGNMAFMVDAGRPTHYSKIGRYPRRRAHHHHHRHPR